MKIMWRAQKKNRAATILLKGMESLFKMLMESLNKILWRNLGYKISLSQKLRIRLHPIDSSMTSYRKLHPRMSKNSNWMLIWKRAWSRALYFRATKISSNTLETWLFRHLPSGRALKDSISIHIIKRRREKRRMPKRVLCLPQNKIWWRWKISYKMNLKNRRKRENSQMSK